MTAPTGGATVSGIAVTISAAANDAGSNCSVPGVVAGVQFKVDGVNIGSEDTTAPFSVTWNATLISNGSHTLTAVARDDSGNTATSQAVTVTVTNLTMLPSSLPDGLINTLYTPQTLTVNGGTAPFTWTFASGTRPPGINLSAQSGNTILISGTPTAAGTFNFTVQVQDSSSPPRFASNSFSVTIYPVLALEIQSLSGDAIDSANISPTQQLRISISVPGTAAPPQVDVNGLMRASFVPVPGGAEDKKMLFENGQNSVNFSIPAGSNKALSSVLFQPGTNAGDITFSVATQNLLTAHLPRLRPSIMSVALSRESNALNVNVIGFSTTRDITSATFTFSGPGMEPKTVDVLSVASAFNTYFARRDDQALMSGSIFVLMMPFTLVNATPAQFDSVTVILRNSLGTSNEGSVTVP